MGRYAAVVLAALFACKGATDKPAENTPVPAHVATGSGSAAVPATDPWNTPAKADPDAPPTLAERAAFANKVCPTVKAPYFFEVTAANGKVSHLLGTRHVSVPLSKFPDVVRTEIKAAKLAVFEVAPEDTTGVPSRAHPLRDELGAADWKHLRELLGKDTADDLVTAAPSAAAVSMMVLYEDPTNMLDKQIEDVVADAKIPARGLETAAFQDGVLDKLLDLRMLKATIEQTKDRAEIEKESRDDLGQYCAGTDDSPGMDAESRAKMIKAGYTAAELDAMDEQLVFARNRSWIPKLEAMFAQGGVFVAVGADHLIGNKGVPALLEARGMKVKRVTPP
jgi:uncharacterized protein YbaP (TraB family)